MKTEQNVVIYLSKDHLRQLVALAKAAVIDAVEGYGEGSYEHTSAIELLDILQTEPISIDAFGGPAGR